MPHVKAADGELWVTLDYGRVAIQNGSVNVDLAWPLTAAAIDDDRIVVLDADTAPATPADPATGTVPDAVYEKLADGSIDLADVSGLVAAIAAAAQDTDVAAEASARTAAIGVEAAARAAADALLAPIASPAFTGNPTAPTPAAADNDTSVATTAFVHGEVATEATTRAAADALKADLASPALSGNPTVPTQVPANNSTRAASTAYADAAVAVETAARAAAVTAEATTRSTADTARQLLIVPTAAKSANYNAVVGDFIPCDISAGGFTVTLPTAPVDASRVVVKVVAVAAAAINELTIAAGGSDVFNVAAGSTTLKLRGKFQSVELQYKASTGIWYVIAGQSGAWSPWVALGAITNVTQDDAMGYCIDEQGIVHLRGTGHATTAIAADLTLFTFPAGFRPIQNTYFDVIGFSFTTPGWRVKTTGVLTTAAGWALSTFGSIDGRSFSTT